MHRPSAAYNRRQVLSGMAAFTIAAAGRHAFASSTLVAPTASTPTPRTLTENDLRNLLYGLGFAASGGGGGYLIGQTLLNAIISDIDPSLWQLWDPTTAVDGDFAVMAGGIGAPTAITSKTILDFVGYAQDAIVYYNGKAGTTINSLVPVEAGPVNGMLALYLGWKYGYKVYDCDGAGRAVPSLTNLVYDFNQSQYKIAPVVLSGLIDYEEQSIVIDPAPTDGKSAEAAIRDNLGEFGDAAALVCWGQTGAELKASTYLLAHTFTDLIDFGAQAAATGFAGAALSTFLKSSSSVIAVYSGFVSQITNGTLPGYDDSVITVGTISSLVYTIHALNENMILTQTIGVNNTTTLATAPSGIAMLFQPGGSGPYVLLNNGDDLPNQNVLGNPILIAVMKESCTLFKSDVEQSFINVLAAAPFNYTGPVVPLGTCSS